MKLKPLSWRQVFAGFFIGLSTVVIFEVEGFLIKIGIGIPAWLTYLLILNLETGETKNE